jgi:hypothetical protein
MDILTILKNVAAVITAAAGVLALFRPDSAMSFTGLNAEGGRGVTEVRAIFGALFIALGLTPLILNNPSMYLLLGIAYLAIALVRLISLIIDRSVNFSNLISLAIEVIFGVILVL